MTPGAIKTRMGLSGSGRKSSRLRQEVGEDASASDFLSEPRSRRDYYERFSFWVISSRLVPLGSQLFLMSVFFARPILPLTLQRTLRRCLRPPPSISLPPPSLTPSLCPVPCLSNLQNRLKRCFPASPPVFDISRCARVPRSDTHSAVFHVFPCLLDLSSLSTLSPLAAKTLVAEHRVRGRSGRVFPSFFNFYFSLFSPLRSFFVNEKQGQATKGSLVGPCRMMMVKILRAI